MSGLTTAQQALLDSLPTSCVESYPPAKKLVALGLAKWGPKTYGNRRLLPTTPMSEPFMPTVDLSPDQLVKVESGEVITWAEAVKRLSAPAPQGIGREEIARVLVDSTPVDTFGKSYEASINAALPVADRILALLPTEPPAQGEG